MTKVLLIGLASILNTAALSDVTTATCTATVSGPTFSFSGRMYFLFDTTCTAPVESITIDASVEGPSTSLVGTKTCTHTDTCSYMIPATYKRGTWTWTNSTTYNVTTYSGGSSLATKTQSFSQ